jgi:hypothetical protein
MEKLDQRTTLQSVYVESMYGDDTALNSLVVSLNNLARLIIILVHAIMEIVGVS